MSALGSKADVRSRGSIPQEEVSGEFGARNQSRQAKKVSTPIINAVRPYTKRAMLSAAAPLITKGPILTTDPEAYSDVATEIKSMQVMSRETARR